MDAEVARKLRAENARLRTRLREVEETLGAVRGGQVDAPSVSGQVYTPANAEAEARKWAHVFEHAEWGVVVADAGGATLAALNPAFARMHGYAVEELKGEPITKVFAPECHIALAEHVEAANRDGHLVWESVHVRKDGTRFPVLIDVTAVNDEAGRTLYRLVNVQDITERKRAEEALRESEALSRAILSSLNTHVCVLDCRGRIIMVNDSWAEFARENGAGADSAVGPGVDYLEVCRVAAEEGDRLAGEARRGIEAVCDGSLDSFQLEYPCHSPTQQRWFLMVVTPLKRREGGAVVAHNDITARMRAEQSLRESEERERLRAEELQTILDAVPVGVWIARDPHCLHITGNKASYEILRLPECANQSLSAPEHERPTGVRVFGPDGREYAPDELPQQRAAATGRTQRGARLDLVFDDGLRKAVYGNAAPLFDAGGRPRGAVSAFLDVTEMVLAEEAMRESREMFERAFSASPDPLVISRRSDGMIREVNESWYTVFGQTREEAVGRSSILLGLYADPDDRGRILKALDAGGRLRDYELRVRGREGERLVLVSMEPITVGGEACLLTIARDVTEKRRSELALRRLAEGLTTAREDERRRIARELHDDASQNLSAVAVRLKLLEARVASDRAGGDEAGGELPALREMIEGTQRSLRRMAHSLHPSTLEHFGIAAALRGFVREESGATGVHVTLDAPDSFLRLARVIESTVYRVAQEAVANALKHAGAASVTVRLRAAGGRLTLRVADDGRGFDPKSPAAHDGLGLISMRERAEMIGGRLVVDSRPGGGATVTLSVPALPPDADGETLQLALPAGDAPPGKN